jgi:hypothetical protein
MPAGYFGVSRGLTTVNAGPQGLYPKTGLFTYSAKNFHIF